jgi:hypothetical protein
VILYVDRNAGIIFFVQDGAVVISGTIEQLQELQTGESAGALLFTGAAASNQEPQEATGAAALIYTGTAEQSQEPQDGDAAALYAILGGVWQEQEPQEQDGTGETEDISYTGYIQERQEPQRQAAAGQRIRPQPTPLQKQEVSFPTMGGGGVVYVKEKPFTALNKSPLKKRPFNNSPLKKSKILNTRWK